MLCYMTHKMIKILIKKNQTTNKLKHFISGYMQRFIQKQIHV